MNEYVGKVCPYCKTPLKEDDEIVVCSVCDMPHHKECWVENEGCTTFGCLGTIKSADGAASAVTTDTLELEEFSEPRERVFCTRCGAESLAPGDAFCRRCGNPLRSRFAPPEPPRSQAAGGAYGGVPGGYTPAGDYRVPSGTADIDPEARLYVGENSEYYIPKFAEMKRLGKQTSWNWSAFLFTPYWLVYRKMYGCGVAVLWGAAVLSLLGLFGSLLAMGGYVAAGCFGNYLYMRQIEKNMAEGKMIDAWHKTQFMARVSGVNKTAPILMALGYTALTTLIVSVG